MLLNEVDALETEDTEKTFFTLVFTAKACNQDSQTFEITNSGERKTSLQLMRLGFEIS